MKMSRQFPLNALRVFEAAARSLSFTKAGEELGMTQTAVSYQVKLLEENIGEPLFLRKARQVALTETGERLAEKAAQAFKTLEIAMEEARNGSSDVLIVHSTPTFALQWLTPRIGAFHLRHPAIAVRLITSGSVVDFDREKADVAIRWGKGDWPRLKAHRIMRLDFTPVLSPALAESIGGIGQPTDLLKLPIISPTDPWWKLWFRDAGVLNPDLETRVANDFGVQTLDARAAMAGLGVAVVNPEHYAEDIAAGRLLQPFKLLSNDGRDYWFVYAETRRNVPRIRAFREWLLNEFSEI
ncbi:LysR substrate-binding domain-containing protein [Agrobacterium sp. NPDC089420]|uniref:LysR substrate-binding domain-containing protein n=1 Tax=Agrobacterium sp. NPDC089420 TaxID=3363918 RepID=UPI00384AF1CA